MRILHIVSTMNQKDYSFLDKMNMETDCIVVNQVGEEGKTTYETKQGNHADIILSSKKGLSNSRNLLLKHMKGDVAIVTDDDLEYFSGYLKEIEKAYRKYGDADIIVFRFTENKEKETRARYNRPLKMNIFTISKAASVEITFRTESIQKASIQFDTLLGVGSVFPTGEENAFLADALRAGLKIYHVPVTLCYTECTDAERGSWVKQHNDDFFYAIGAAYYRIYRKIYVLMFAAYFALKRKKLFHGVNMMHALRCVLKGKQQYKQFRRQCGD